MCEGLHSWKMYIVMFCAIWYHLYNLKNVKKHPGSVLLLATFVKVTLLHGCFSRFLDCTNGTKSRNAPHIQWPFGFCCTIISEFINSMQCLYLLSCLFYTGSVLHISCFYIRVIIAENYMYLVKDRSCYFDFFWWRYFDVISSLKMDDRFFAKKKEFLFSFESKRFFWYLCI